ncbi:hypothetical protein [Haloplanus pelagicus]|jgi:nucleotide-binding universal stress UspA family protein|uniref:hypothetical protein n=1 Tax=Haloplanus pelagicus TaxID=2949995 RepID=UPI00203ED396|nr:hypothetical protein [Haloplanus sp. HW8-1]
MSFVVPFDGSDLAEAAMVRAVAFGGVLDERVVVSVIPSGNDGYARERDWLDAGEPYDRGTLVGRLHEAVTSLAPDTEFRYETVGRHAASGTLEGPARRRGLSTPDREVRLLPLNAAPGGKSHGRRTAV